ncbi:MAG TPA: sigma-70 family RNA polymerase sigma factor [Gemmata sp.]|nr:sigma-70 family RNA polymerase sigma factor [Gemmata sp.]
MDPNPFTAVDRDLLKRCLNRDPGSWNDFVDRFLSLIYHVIGYTAHLRSARLNPEDVEDIAAEVLLKIVASDFRLLREFRGEASLATYLTVVSRRICIQELIRRQKAKEALARGDMRVPNEELDEEPAAQKGVESLDEVEKLLRRLSGKEREIVRLYYLEGRTYEEISTETNVPVNTIGAVLSRARKKLRMMVKSSGVDSLSLAVMPPSPPPASTLTPKPASPKATISGDSGSRPVKPQKPMKPTKDKKEGE